MELVIGGYYYIGMEKETNSIPERGCIADEENVPRWIRY